MSRAVGRAGRLTRIRLPRDDRFVYAGRSRHGVEVRVAPMPGFTRTYAVLTARYGVLDTCLPDGTPLPEGTAHMLEHRMLQKAGGDLFDVFDARGAYANAYTSYTNTSYVFGCASRWEENLADLVGALATLDVDDPAMARERGIVGQEIAMDADDPLWQGSLLLMRALYRRHPVRLDILGTGPSVAAIDAALMRRVHAAWYHPRNLVLSVAGAADPRRVLEIIDAAPAPRRGRRAPRRRAFEEPRSVKQGVVRVRLPVGRPYVWLGMKDDAVGGGTRLVRRQILSTLALDALFRDGGSVQAPLHEAGLIDDEFYATYESEADFGHALVKAEVEDVSGYRRALLGRLREAARRGVSTIELERARRRLWGRRLRVLDAPESLAHWMLGVAVEGVSPSLGASVLSQVTTRAVTRRLRDLVARPRSWALIEPL